MSNFQKIENFEQNFYQGVKKLEATNKDRARVEELKQQKLKEKEEKNKKEEPSTKHSNDDKGSLIDTFA